jgi:hypothetical protein
MCGPSLFSDATSLPHRSSFIYIRRPQIGRLGCIRDPPGRVGHAPWKTICAFQHSSQPRIQQLTLREGWRERHPCIQHTSLARCLPLLQTKCDALEPSNRMWAVATANTVGWPSSVNFIQLAKATSNPETKNRTLDEFVSQPTSRLHSVDVPEGWTEHASRTPRAWWKWLKQVTRSYTVH